MPVVDQVAADYLDAVTFLAVAGRASFEATAPRADELFSDNLAWGLDESVWELYGVRGQPVTFLVAEGVVVDMWFGALGADELRSRIDAFLAVVT